MAMAGMTTGDELRAWIHVRGVKVSSQERSRLTAGGSHASSRCGPGLEVTRASGH